MVADEFIEGVKLLDPQEVLATAVSEDFEVLHLVCKPAMGGGFCR